MSPCHPAGILAVGSRSPCAHGQALSPHPREGPVPRAGSPGRPSAPRPAGAARSSAAPQGAWREAGTAALRTGLERGTGQGPGPGKAAEGQQAGSPRGLRGQHPLAWSWQVETCLLWHSLCRVTVPRHIESRCARCSQLCRSPCSFNQ